jgi:hypothetical protein
VPQNYWYTLYGQELKTNMAARFENVDESYTGAGLQDANAGIYRFITEKTL